MWFRPYPICVAESGGDGGGSGAAGADAPAPPEAAVPALAPLHWAAGVPEDRQKLPIVQDAKSLTAFIDNAEETKRFVGDSIRVPKSYDPVKGPGDGVDLTPMFRKLGMPEKPGDYAIDRGEIPEGFQVTVNEDEQRQFLEVAHGIGLAPWQVNKLAKWNTQNEIRKANGRAGEEASAIARGEAQLYEMHGVNTPHVQADGRFVVEKLMGQGLWGSPELAERIDAKFTKAGFWKDPDVMTGMATLGEQMRGGRYLGAEQPIHGAETPSDVEAKLALLNEKNTAQRGLSAVDEKEADRLYALKARYQAA